MRRASLLILLLVIALLFSAACLPAAKRTKIGVVRISGIIWDLPLATEATVKDIIKMLRYAREEPSVKAVVLEIDSYGGEAWPSEEVYLTVLSLREAKPVVVTIDGAAASGAYYIAAAADYLYAKPTSMVGSVGAWMFLPSPARLYEDIFTTGPFKITGGSERKAVLLLEMFKKSFLQAVATQRGEKLKINLEDLSRAEIYSGLEALRYGLIDELGSTGEALEKAAAMAGITTYEVVVINEALGIEPYEFLPLFQALSRVPEDILPLFYYLYIEPE